MAKPKRPSDPMQLAKMIADIATGEVIEKKYEQKLQVISKANIKSKGKTKGKTK